MDKQIIKQVPDIRKEIRDLEREVIAIEKRITILKNSEVCDTVTGSREDLTIGPIKVHGHPQREYGRRIRELQMKKALIEKKQTELMHLEREAEEHIQSIRDSKMRRIIRYRYIDDLSWQQVAARMGGKYTADGCRMAHNRFLSD